MIIFSRTSVGNKKDSKKSAAWGRVCGLSQEVDDWSREDPDWDFDGRLASAEVSARSGASKSVVAMIYGPKIADLAFRQGADCPAENSADQQSAKKP